MPTARAISSIGASCMPRSSNSARVAATRSRSRVAAQRRGLRSGHARQASPSPVAENTWLTVVLSGHVAPWLSAAPDPKVPALQRRALQRGARAVHAAAARRLPRADQPAVVDAGAARPHRAHRARDRRRGRRRHQARLGVGGPRARPVPAHRRRRRRRPPLARLLADLRPGPPRRLHQHHAEARRRGQGLAVPRARGAARARSSASAASRARSCCPTRCPRSCSSSAPAAASRRS